MTIKYIKSPLNYTGGKYNLLKSILPSFPRPLNQFVDLFAGGLNVGINVDAKTIYVNDQITYLIELLEFFKSTDVLTFIGMIREKIDMYGLSKTNVEAYRKLREEYNRSKDILDLFILTCYSFNHQIRFNNSHAFNTPFGKNRSSYNDSIETNLIRFCTEIQKKNIIFSCSDFRKFNFDILNPGDLVYCDPPYLITTGSYNDGNRGFSDWRSTEDKALSQILDSLDTKGILFAFSNVFVHKGLTNDYLIKWSKKYQTNYLDKEYSNCSYHFKDRKSKTIEVLITNYDWEVEKWEQLELEIL